MKIICILTFLTTLGHGGHGTPVVEGPEGDDKAMEGDDTIRTTVKSAQGLKEETITTIKSDPGRGEETTMKTPIQKLQGPEKLSRRSTLIEALKWPGEKTEVRRETDFDDNQSMLDFLDNPKQPGNAKERKI